MSSTESRTRAAVLISAAQVRDLHAHRAFHVPSAADLQKATLRAFERVWHVSRFAQRAQTLAAKNVEPALTRLHIRPKQQVAKEAGGLLWRCLQGAMVRPTHSIAWAAMTGVSHLLLCAVGEAAPVPGLRCVRSPVLRHPVSRSTHAMQPRASTARCDPSSDARGTSRAINWLCGRSRSTQTAHNPTTSTSLSAGISVHISAAHFLRSSSIRALLDKQRLMTLHRHVIASPLLCPLNTCRPQSPVCSTGLCGKDVDAVTKGADGCHERGPLDAGVAERTYCVALCNDELEGSCCPSGVLRNQDVMCVHGRCTPRIPVAAGDGAAADGGLLEWDPSSPPTAAVTLVTQGTADRIAALEETMTRWPGPITVVFAMDNRMGVSDLALPSPPSHHLRMPARGSHFRTRLAMGTPLFMLPWPATHRIRSASLWPNLLGKCTWPRRHLLRLLDYKQALGLTTLPTMSIDCSKRRAGGGTTSTRTSLCSQSCKGLSATSLTAFTRRGFHSTRCATSPSIALARRGQCEWCFHRTLRVKETRMQPVASSCSSDHCHSFAGVERCCVVL